MATKSLTAINGILDAFIDLGSQNSNFKWGLIDTISALVNQVLRVFKEQQIGEWTIAESTTICRIDVRRKENLSKLH